MPTPFILKTGDVFAERYRLVKRLGSGGFSEVWLVKNMRANIDQALKVYSGLDEDGFEIFRKEFTRVHKLNHQNLLKATDFDIYKELPFLIMPYCEHGSLISKVGQLNEKEIARLFKDIAGALNYLHQSGVGIIHQDIKPDNFLIGNNNEYLLADFGISTVIRKNLSDQGYSVDSDAVGLTPRMYRGPELFSKGGSAVNATDIWALGASIYELITGGGPFGNIGGAMQEATPEPHDLPPEYSRELNKLVKLCLSKDPWNRPTAAKIYRFARTFVNEGYWPEELQEEPKNSYPLPAIKSPRPPEPMIPSTPAPRAPRPKRPAPKKKKSPLWLILIWVFLGFSALGMTYFIYDVVNGSGNLTLVEEPLPLPSVKETIVDPVQETNKKRDVKQKDESELANNDLVGTKENQPQTTQDRTPSGCTTFIRRKDFTQANPTQMGSDCFIYIEKINFFDDKTELHMSLKSCGEVSIYPSGSPKSFYIQMKKTGKKYHLKAVRGIPTNKQLTIEKKHNFVLIFSPIPHSDHNFESFKLSEGDDKRSEGTHFWDFETVDCQRN